MPPERMADLFWLLDILLQEIIVSSLARTFYQSKKKQKPLPLLTQKQVQRRQPLPLPVGEYRVRYVALLQTKLFW